MKIIYLTANVLGDSGANAAELFPKLAILSPDISKVWVADIPANRKFIVENQFAQFLRLRSTQTAFLYSSFRNAMRVAKKSRNESVDVIHVFYRQVNIPTIIFLRLLLWILRGNTKILVDHRSVNLARGTRGNFKNIVNQFMQLFVHRLVGNPLAVESNHFFIRKPHRIVDLGYDNLPEGNAVAVVPGEPISIWYIGSLKPRNRKSEFIIEVFKEMEKRHRGLPKILFRVAGPTRPEQEEKLRKNGLVKYYGTVPREELYQLLRNHPGIGLAYMNQEFHGTAPSLKLCEYAIMRYFVLASDTIGLNTQVRRMNLGCVLFVDETISDWVQKIGDSVNKWQGLAPVWNDAQIWSYESIFSRQVLATYKEMIADA